MFHIHTQERKLYQVQEVQGILLMAYILRYHPGIVGHITSKAYGNTMKLDWYYGGEP